MRDDLIFLDVQAEDKADAISQTVKRMKQSGVLKNANKFLDAVFERENLGSTAIGKGMALPHARTENIDSITITVVRLAEGVEFGAADKQPVNLIFLLGTPLKTVSEYLGVLSKLSKILKEDKVRKKLLKADSAALVRSIFEEAES